MTKCKSCGAAGQTGTYCEECGKPVAGGSKEVSSGGGAYKMQAIAVGIVVLALVGTFLLLSSGSTAKNASAASSVDTALQVSGSQNEVTGTPLTVAGSGGAGTQASGSTETLTVSIQKMTCGGCVYNIETAVKKLAGVESAVVNLGTKSGVITYDPAVVTKQKIIDTITGIGYPASEVSGTSLSSASAGAVIGSAGASGGTCGVSGGSGGGCGGSGGTCGGGSGGGCGCGG